MIIANNIQIVSVQYQDHKKRHTFYVHPAYVNTTPGYLIGHGTFAIINGSISRGPFSEFLQAGAEIQKLSDKTGVWDID